MLPVTPLAMLVAVVAEVAEVALVAVPTVRLEAVPVSPVPAPENEVAEILPTVMLPSAARFTRVETTLVSVACNQVGAVAPACRM